MVVGFLPRHVREAATDLCDLGRANLVLGMAATISTGYVIWMF
jgi:hypothetical protein